MKQEIKSLFYLKQKNISNNGAQSQNVPYGQVHGNIKENIQKPP